MDPECICFCEKCEAAGMTTSPDWTPPQDQTKLKEIVRDHTQLIKLVGPNSGTAIYAMQPLIWHVYVKLVYAMKQSKGVMASHS